MKPLATVFLIVTLTLSATTCVFANDKIKKEKIVRSTDLLTTEPKKGDILFEIPMYDVITYCDFDKQIVASQGRYTCVATGYKRN